MDDCDRLLVEERVEGHCHFDGKVLRLEVDKVELSDGSTSVREVVRHPGASVMVPVTDTGHLLFVRQYRYPTSEVLLELPAGKLDPGEPPQDCAARETAEETGWRPETVERLGEFYTAPGFSDELIHAFLVTDLKRDTEATRDADELVEVVELAPSEYDDLLVAGGIRDAKTIAAITLWRTSNR